MGGNAILGVPAEIDSTQIPQFPDACDLCTSECEFGVLSSSVVLSFKHKVDATKIL